MSDLSRRKRQVSGSRLVTSLPYYYFGVPISCENAVIDVQPFLFDCMYLLEAEMVVVPAFNSERSC